MRANAVAKYRSDPEAATESKRRLRAKNRPIERWRRLMDPAYLKGMDEAAEARRIRRLTNTFHHSLWLHQHPYPKGYPHSYSAKAAIERINRAGQTALSTTTVDAKPVPSWARDNLSPAEALEKLRAVHKAQQPPPVTANLYTPN